MKWWLLAPLFLFSATPVSAAIQFNIYDAQISDTEIDLSASISGLISSSCSSENKCYLQGTLREPTKSYFGQTRNNVGTWVDYISSPELEYIQSTFYSFQPVSGSWFGQLKMRFSTSDPDYKGSGNYELKLRRFSGNSKNSSGDSNTLIVALSATISTPTPAPTHTTTPTPTLSSTSNDYSNLFISEYLPYPDSGNEWIEIYNGNGSEVNLNGWFVDDVADSGSAPIDISGTIGAKIYKQFYLSDSFFNNNGDDVRLLNSSKTEKSKTSFSVSTKAKSWSKDGVGNWCQTDPSPNSANPSCPTPTPTPATPSPTPLDTSTPQPIPLPTNYEPTNQLTNTPQVLGESTSKSNIWSYILIGVGLVLILISVGLVVVGQRSGKLIFHEEN